MKLESGNKGKYHMQKACAYFFVIKAQLHSRVPKIQPTRWHLQRGALDSGIAPIDSVIVANSILEAIFNVIALPF
jgi:hypothetical protein